MNDYQKEQLEALQIIRKRLISPESREQITNPVKLRGQNSILSPKFHHELNRYLHFRTRTARFHQAHFEPTCTDNCYLSNLSACCSRDGIIIFFADVVINALESSSADLDLLEHAIANPADPGKCIFLSQNGCLWRIKPIVCEMFVCNTAKKAAFENNPEAEAQWKELEKERKTFTWPDQPVLFEHLERIFLDLGEESSLMHIHKSPGLKRIKKNRRD